MTKSFFAALDCRCGKLMKTYNPGLQAIYYLHMNRQLKNVCKKQSLWLQYLCDWLPDDCCIVCKYPNKGLNF